VADLTAGAGVVRKRLADHSELIGALADGALPEVIAELAERVVEVLRAGGKVLLFGNGGSNADASHLAAEFVGRLHRERIALPALSLGDQHAAITAIGNDLGFEEIFARGIDAFGDAGDIAIALTTSGRSRNVLRGLETARARGLYCVVFTGEGNADIDAHVVVRIPSGDTQQIQEATMHLGHTLCGLVEDTLPSPRPA
jgi:D-sedoheptulose 7-phosphate isomerase